MAKTTDLSLYVSELINSIHKDSKSFRRLIADRSEINFYTDRNTLVKMVLAAYRKIESPTDSIPSDIPKDVLKVIRSGCDDYIRDLNSEFNKYYEGTTSKAKTTFTLETIKGEHDPSGSKKAISVIIKSNGAISSGYEWLYRRTRKAKQSLYKKVNSQFDRSVEMSMFMHLGHKDSIAEQSAIYAKNVIESAIAERPQLQGKETSDFLIAVEADLSKLFGVGSTSEISQAVKITIEAGRTNLEKATEEKLLKQEILAILERNNRKYLSNVVFKRAQNKITSDMKASLGRASGRMKNVYIDTSKLSPLTDLDNLNRDKLAGTTTISKGSLQDKLVTGRLSEQVEASLDEIRNQINARYLNHEVESRMGPQLVSKTSKGKARERKKDKLHIDTGRFSSLVTLAELKYVSSGKSIQADYRYYGDPGRGGYPYTLYTRKGASPLRPGLYNRGRDVNRIIEGSLREIFKAKFTKQFGDRAVKFTDLSMAGK